MKKDEILKAGEPVRPYCHSNYLEEQWYSVGLFEGATADPWNKVSSSNLPSRPKKEGPLCVSSDLVAPLSELVLVMIKNKEGSINFSPGYYNFSTRTWHYYPSEKCIMDRVTHWMKIELPEEEETK